MLQQKSYGLEPNCQINHISYNILQTNKFDLKWNLKGIGRDLDLSNVFFTFAENVICIHLFRTDALRKTTVFSGKIGLREIRVKFLRKIIGRLKGNPLKKF